MNIFLNKEYFKFSKNKYGPYAHSIDKILQSIDNYKDYYSINNKEAYELLYKTLISKKTEENINNFNNSIEKSVNLLNKTNDDNKIELLATITYIIETNKNIEINEIIKKIHEWSNEKLKKFSEDKIKKAIYFLEDQKIIEKVLIGYIINN